MSYRQVSQEYGDDSDDDEVGFELPTSSGPARQLGAGSALNRLYSSTPKMPYLQIVVFLSGLLAVYFYGVHEGKGASVDLMNNNHNDADDNPFRAFHDATSPPTDPALPSQADNDKQAPMKFTMDQLQATRSEAQKFLTMLESYYTSPEQTSNMLLNAWNDPWDFNHDNYNAPSNSNEHRTSKLVDTMARALVTDDQSKFLIGGIGSSVMAGHDNCHYDAYQNQMMRNFGGIWEKAGMEFVFQNAGEGGGCGDRLVLFQC